MQITASNLQGGDYVFANFENNKIMIMGAYKKLKSYFYYDKTILYNKMRLATWECTIEDMKRRINDLASFMCSLETDTNTNYLSMLMKQIALIPMPKSFEESKDTDNFLQNVLPSNRMLNKINFFIKAPVEVLILDIIWSLMIGKIANDQGLMRYGVYANHIKVNQVFNNNHDLFKGIDFKSNRLFRPYFRQYSSWRNNALESIKNRYESGQDSILLSLDIQSYYYSVVFEFDQLPSILNNDMRLGEIECLTRIIKNIHISYTAEMQKYRKNISADCKKGQSVFPIGLTSSMILANLYLKDLDDAIQKKLNPSYYGRYVDDILIVIDKTANMEISLTNIIEKTFIKKDIIESRKDSYHILIPNGNLSLQKDKIRCIYFDHNEPDAMIKLLCDASNLKPSMSDGFLMPDIDLSEKNFDECAYSIGQGTGTLKVRNFLFATNNYGASLFLNDLIRASKNVNIHEVEHYIYIERQLKQILRFYSAQQAIEYRSAWINVFNLILLNERYDYFIKFYAQTYKAINSITAESVECIIPEKLEYILTRLKEALYEQLSIAASIALAPHALCTIRLLIDEQIENKFSFGVPFDFETVFSNARDIRDANMFNNHVLAFPLLSYINGVFEDTSLVNLDTSNMQNLFATHDLDEFKMQYVPRFIHLEELYLLLFIIDFPRGGNPLFRKIENINSKFVEVNQIKSFKESISESYESINNCLQGITIKDASTQRKVKVALASVYIDEEKDVIPVLRDSKHNLSPTKKGELYRMLNDSKDKGAKIIVFPEFFMPIEWLQEILIFSRKNQIAILSGLRYLVSGDKAYNYISVIQPFSDDKFKYSIPLFREKNYYAPAEKIELAKYQLRCEDPERKSTQLIMWNGLSYSNLMCYELTNIEFRYALRGLIDLLVVPELNKDTNYFSNMVEATTRDLHTFVIQVNTSKYGDSRITGPYNSLFKDIIKLKGGEDNIILTGTIDTAEIENNRETYLQKLQDSIRTAFNGNVKDKNSNIRKTKDPVAGFSKQVLK